MRNFWQRLWGRFALPAEIMTNEMSDSQKYLLVGLGNPGRKYAGNRHNIGFMLIDRLADEHAISLGRVKNKAIMGEGRIADRPVVLAKPQTYMNRSGDAVGPLVNFYKIPTENILVAYDELDIPFGELRLRAKGGAGGHNGMRSLIQHLGQDFARMRLGIGRPPGRMPPAAYVLQDFGLGDRPVVDDLLDLAVKATVTYLGDGIDLAMTRHNGSVLPDES